jgi:lauroyl/myristoyl acyltransferase
MFLVILFRIVGFVLSIMPGFLMEALARGLGAFFFKRSKSQKEILRDNLSTVYQFLNRGQISDQDLKQVFINYALYYMEVLSQPFLKQKTISSIPVVGTALLKEGFERGRGVIILTAHFGNWDLAGVVTAQHCQGFYALAEKLNNAALLKFFIKTRAAKGVQVIPATHSAFRETKKVLAQNKAVAILADRDMANKGIPALFFGKETTLPAGPALLAYETGCMLLPGYLWRKSSQYQVVGFEPIAYDQTLPKEEFLKNVTQQIANRLEKMIAQDPLQWCMLQPIWKNQ